MKGTKDRGGGGGGGTFVNSPVNSSVVTSSPPKTSIFDCSLYSGAGGFGSEIVAGVVSCRGGRTTLKAGTGVITSLEVRT